MYCEWLHNEGKGLKVMKIRRQFVYRYEDMRDKWFLIHYKLEGINVSAFSVYPTESNSVKYRGGSTALYERGWREQSLLVSVFGCVKAADSSFKLSHSHV